MKRIAKVDPPKELDIVDIHIMRLFGLYSGGFFSAISPFAGGETAGWQRMNVWLDAGLHSYKHTFRRLKGYNCIESRTLISSITRSVSMHDER
jgi:hypothetical protein